MDADYAPGHLQFPNKIYLLIRRRVFCRVIRERFEFSWIYVFLWIPLFRIVAMLCSPVNIPMHMNNLPKPLTDEQYEYFSDTIDNKHSGEMMMGVGEAKETFDFVFGENFGSFRTTCDRNWLN